MIQRKTFEKEKFQISIARLKKENQNFEINIDPDLAIELKEGKNIDIEDVLKSQEIFFNATEGDLASEEIMKSIFGTDNKLEIAKIILEKGEIQLTSEHRQKIRDQKKKKLVNIIHRNAIDPKTNLPHPVQRIENALEEAKVKLDEFKKVEDQVQDILKKLQVIIPIKFDKKILEIKIDAAHAHVVYEIANKNGKLKENNWLSDGSWFGRIEIPAGLQNEIIDELNSKTHGGVDIKIID
jgi:ribosome maturation protein SDO1